MIPQRFERRTYPYQEYTLPVKLRNLSPKYPIYLLYIYSSGDYQAAM